jgi:FAD/FMN-containing dehydrogenase
MVLPSGDLLEVTDAQPELMQKVRASYGTFGIVYEVTFRIRAMLPLAVHHKTYHLADFIQQLPQLKALNYAMMYYIFPFDDLITVEFRSYNPGASGDPNKIIWPLRNYIWGTSGPKFAHDMDQTISDQKIRYGVIDAFNKLWRLKLENIITSDNTVPADEIIRYPDVSNDSRYTFSLYAFPEEQYPSVLSDFFKFSTDYYAQKGYRTDLLDVGYRISQDQQSLLSYSWDGPVMTIDPVSTRNPGWDEFIDAYNQFCSERNGKPVLNQTAALTPDLAKKAFGPRLATLEETRQQYDPAGRLLNAYFRGILSS